MGEPHAEAAEAADATAADTAAADVTAAETPGAPAPARVSLSVRTLVLTAVLALMAVAIATLGWLYAGARSELAAAERLSADHRHAEQTALEYAVGAARMDYRDLGTWKTRLVAGTSPELAARLGEAADSMEQILAPLQWESTAKPVVATVRSDTGGSYVVDAFVSVLTKTVQAPQGLQSTATYSITLDPGDDWLITDVGGIDAVMGRR